MHAPVNLRPIRLLTALLATLILAACGQGDGPESIPNSPATPLPEIPVGFCDPINFEILCPAVAIVNFNGGATTIIDNPDQSGINTSDLVAQMQKFPDEPFGGTRLDVAGPIDFSNGEAFTIKVWSQRVVPLTFKLEQLNVELAFSHSGGGTWEELCFDFSGQTGGVPNDGLTLIFDNGVLGQADTDPDNWTFYYDDITQVASCPTAPGPTTFSTITFDDSALTYTLTGFGGAEDSSIVDDPAGGSNQVVRVNRSDMAETFAGTTVSLGPNQSVPVIPLDASNTRMTARVWSPAAGIPVRMKIENAAASAIAVETEALTTTSGAWETLTFDFSAQAMGTPAFDASAEYNKIIIFFNFGTDGATAGAQTYYFDDIDVATGGGGGTPTPFAALTFDDSAVTYTLRGFGGAEDSTVAADPTDAGNNVVQVNRSATADTFAGTVVSTLANEAVGVIPLDASNTEMTVRVYAPAAGIPVRLKIENSGDPAVSVETEAMTTAADTWETLTFDFTNQVSGTAAFNPAATYDKIVVFFNFGTDGATAGAQTFFFDDVDVASSSGGGGPGSAGSPIAFESGSATFNDFEGGAATVVANPAPGGINTSSFVGQMQKFDGQPFAGSTLDLGATVAIAAGDSYKMKVRAQRAVVVTFKLEPIGDERTATYSGSGDWEELCFDFTGVAGDVTGITLIFDNGTVGDAAGDPDNWTFQFDDIEQTSDTCPAPAAFSTLTFDDSAVTYTLRDFGGAASTVTNDPAGGSNMVVQVVRSAAAETFAGTVVSTLANEAVGVIPLDAMNTTMTVRVYSPAAGIPVRLKIENSLFPAVSVETEASTTTANAWETLTFDFTNEVSGTAAFDAAATYDKIVVFFNFGTDGATAGEQTFYFDDVAAGAGGGGSGMYTTITFDDMATTYTLRGFGGAEDSSVVADPVGGGNMVVQVNRSAAAETFAGTVVSTGPNESVPAIPLDAMDTTMTVRVYAPAAGIVVRLKVENSGDDTITVETEATTTAANTWETLTFDFANEAMGTAAFNPASTYDKIAIFFNFGTNGATAGAQTFYFDDIAVN